MRRQKLRKLLLIIAILLFPITILYFSPALIITAATEGIINGSFIVFAALFLSSIFFGRIFCGFLCPGGGLGECAFAVNNKVPKQGWRNHIKYVIWFFWIGAVLFCFLKKGEITEINFFYQTDHGISVSNIHGYIIYYAIVCLIFIPALLFGKRAFCHYLCWMAPFMVIGEKVRNLLHLPGLHIASKSENCTSCKKCNKVCPMGIHVEHMVKTGDNNFAECINCGECIDKCPEKVLHYSMKKEIYKDTQNENL